MTCKACEERREKFKKWVAERGNSLLPARFRLTPTTRSGKSDPPVSINPIHQTGKKEDPNG